jgi:hypothetical protein
VDNDRRRIAWTKKKKWCGKKQKKTAMERKKKKASQKNAWECECVASAEKYPSEKRDAPHDQSSRTRVVRVGSSGRVFFGLRVSGELNPFGKKRRG